MENHSGQSDSVSAAQRPRFPGPARAWVSPRRRRFWLVLVVAIYALAGFVFAPWLIERQLPGLIEAQTGTPAALGEARVNPFTLRVELRELRLGEAETPVLAVRRAAVNFGALWSVWHRAWVLQTVDIDAPQLQIERFADGSLNLARLIPEGDDSEPATDMPRLIVQSFALTRAEADVIDRVPATDFTTRIGPLDLHFFDFSTLPDASGRQVLSLLTPEGIALGWQGSVAVTPLASSGHITGSGPWVPLGWRYLRDQLGFEVTQGELDFAFDYEFSMPAGGDPALLIHDFHAGVQRLELLALGADTPFLELPSLQLEGGRMDLAARSFEAQALTVSEPQLRVTRGVGGEFDLLQRLATAQPEPVVAEALPPDADPIDEAWDVVLQRFELQGMAVAFTEKSLREPAELNIATLELTARSVRSQPESVIPFELRLQPETGGEVRLDGAVVALPELWLDSALTLQTIDVAMFSPWLAEQLRARIDGGTLDAEMQILVDPQQPLGATGSLRIDDFELIETDTDSRLLGWQALDVDRFDFSLADNSLDVSTVALSEPYLRFLIEEDGATNLQQLVRESGESAEAEPAADVADANTDSAMAVNVTRISVSAGASDFTDRNLPLPFSAAIVGLEGSVEALSTVSVEPATINLQGQVEEYGLAQVKGGLSIANLSADTDVQVLFRNVELPDLSPYTIKFAGRRIEDGRLDLDLRYRIDDGKLRGANSIVIDRLELGEKVDHPDAANLPLGLAVALLKQPDGTIDIDLPVEGDVNDPEFGIGQVVWKAFANLIAKAVTAPFRLLGSLVGAGDTDLDRILFEPGVAELTPPEREKLDKLAQALAQRPELAVQVMGTVSADEDSAALRKAAVQRAEEQALESLPARKQDAALAERQRLALEALAKTALPEGAADAAQAAAMRPENPDDPDSAQQLDLSAYLAALRERLAAAQPVSDAAVQQLGRERAQAVRAALANGEGVSESQIESSDEIGRGDLERGWVTIKLEAQAL